MDSQQHDNARRAADQFSIRTEKKLTKAHWMHSLRHHCLEYVVVLFGLVFERKQRATEGEKGDKAAVTRRCTASDDPFSFPTDTTTTEALDALFFVTIVCAIYLNLHWIRCWRRSSSHCVCDRHGDNTTTLVKKCEKRTKIRIPHRIQGTFFGSSALKH
jgi:hypothetical protein